MFNRWLFTFFLVPNKGSVKVVKSIGFVSSSMFILQLNIFFYGYESDERNTELRRHLPFYPLKFIEFIICITPRHTYTYFLSSFINTYSICMALLSFHFLPFFVCVFPFYFPILMSLFYRKENGKRYRQGRCKLCVYGDWVGIIWKKRDLYEDSLKYDHSIIMFKYGTKER